MEKGFLASFTSGTCAWDWLPRVFVYFICVLSPVAEFFTPVFLTICLGITNQRIQSLDIFLLPLSMHKEEWIYFNHQIQVWTWGDDTSSAFTPQASSLFLVHFRRGKMSWSLLPEQSQGLLSSVAKPPLSCQSNDPASNSAGNFLPRSHRWACVSVKSWKRRTNGRWSTRQWRR